MRTPAASACEIARSSVRAAARSPSPSPSISEAASSIPLGFATPWPAISGAEPCVGPKTPGPGLRQAAGGDDPRAVPAGGGEVGDELGVRLLGDDDAEALGRVHQPRAAPRSARAARPRRRDAARPPSRRRCSTSGRRRRRSTRRAAGAGEVERAADDERLELVVERADDRDVAVGEPDALDAPGQVELRLHALERGLLRQRDEHGVGRRGRPRASRPAAGGRGG